MQCRIFVLAAASCGAMLFAACSGELPASRSPLGPTAVNPVASSDAGVASSTAGATAVNPVASSDVGVASSTAAATASLVEFGPIPIRFPLLSSCLGDRVLISGAFSGQNRFVTMPDGSMHLTQLIDVSHVTIALGDTVWTPGPAAHEIFIINERQSEHVGKVIFRAEGGRPELRFVHTIHMVRLPSGELQVNRQILDVVCVGRNP
jgi:hypothetical protein